MSLLLSTYRRLDNFPLACCTLETQQNRFPFSIVGEWPARAIYSFSDESGTDGRSELDLAGILRGAYRLSAYRFWSHWTLSFYHFHGSYCRWSYARDGPVLLNILSYHTVFASSILPKYIYAGYESHLRVPVILVVDIYADFVAYIANNFEWTLRTKNESSHRWDISVIVFNLKHRVIDVRFQYVLATSCLKYFLNITFENNVFLLWIYIVYKITCHNM